MRLKKTREEWYQPRLVRFRLKRDQLAAEELTLVTAKSKASESVSDASIISKPYFTSVIMITGTAVTPTPSGNATAEGNDVNSSSGSISAFLSITFVALSTAWVLLL